jgi:hypothetical protein
MFLYANSLRAGIEPAWGPCGTPASYNGGMSTHFHHREFLRLITPQYGCYRPITLTISKHTTELNRSRRPCPTRALIRYNFHRSDPIRYSILVCFDMASASGNRTPLAPTMTCPPGLRLQPVERFTIWKHTAGYAPNVSSAIRVELNTICFHMVGAQGIEPW